MRHSRAHDVRLRNPNANAHRSQMRRLGVNMDWWNDQYSLQDGHCAGCHREVVYLVPFPTRHPQRLICKLCQAAWDNVAEELPILDHRVQWLKEELVSVREPDLAILYLNAVADGKVIKPFGAPLTAEETDLAYEGKVFFNTWLGAPEEHRPSEESLRIKNK